MSTVAAVEANTVEPGIHQGLSFTEYHAIDAVNNSRLEPFNRSAAHAREEMLHPSDGTSDLAFGHAFHVAMLEPERFLAEYAIPPKVDRRCKAGKATWAQWEADNPNKLLISADEAIRIDKMHASLAAHATAGEMLSGPGANELTLVWDDPESGTRCKARLDRFCGFGGWAWIVDVKTSRDARERSFQKDIAYYGYARQAGWYRRGLRILRPGETRFAFTVVEKEPPFAVAVWELDELALEQGERESVAHLRQFEECMKSDSWPAYDSGMGLVSLPPWATDKLDLG